VSWSSQISTRAALAPRVGQQQRQRIVVILKVVRLFQAHQAMRGEGIEDCVAQPAALDPVAARPTDR
jgi:hypothetical protein